MNSHKSSPMDASPAGRTPGGTGEQSEGVAEASHTLAGSSITCGVQGFTPPLRKLERLGQTGDLSAAAPLFDQVRQAFPRVQDVLHQFLSTL